MALRNGAGEEEGDPVGLDGEAAGLEDDEGVAVEDAQPLLPPRPPPKPPIRHRGAFSGEGRTMGGPGRRGGARSGG